MEFYKKSKWIMVGSVAGAYAVAYGLYALLYWILGDVIGMVFVGVCLIACFKTVKDLIKPESILGYFITFIVATFIGQFVAPLILGLILANKIKYSMLINEVEESKTLTVPQLVILEKDIDEYIKEYEKIKDTDENAKFRKIKPNFFGFKDYFDVLYLKEKIEKRTEKLLLENVLE